MRYNEFSSLLVEAAAPKIDPNTGVTNQFVDRDTIEGLLKQGGLHNTLWKTANKLEILVDIPDGENKDEFRKKITTQALMLLKKGAPKSKPEYTMNVSSSIGGIIFGDGSPVQVFVKDAGGKGEKSAGVGNETKLVQLLTAQIDLHGKINVTFVDPRGKKISIKNCDNVVSTGKDVAERKKADVVLTSSKGSLPISLKQVDADSWESGDTLFGQQAGQIVQKLIKKGLVTLTKIKEVPKRGKMVSVYKLDKEIVVEPSEKDAMNAIFGSDLLPGKGGVAIQTFQDHHVSANGNNITIECTAVITKKEDIPESHLMVWLIRNSSDRTSEDSGVGIPGIRVLGSVLTRAIGRKGQKVGNVILVDVNGNVVREPNRTPIQPGH